MKTDLMQQILNEAKKQSHEFHGYHADWISISDLRKILLTELPADEDPFPPIDPNYNMPIIEKIKQAIYRHWQDYTLPVFDFSKLSKILEDFLPPIEEKPDPTVEAPPNVLITEGYAPPPKECDHDFQPIGICNNIIEVEGGTHPVDAIVFKCTKCPVHKTEKTTK